MSAPQAITDPILSGSFSGKIRDVPGYRAFLHEQVTHWAQGIYLRDVVGENIEVFDIDLGNLAIYLLWDCQQEYPLPCHDTWSDEVLNVNVNGVVGQLEVS